PAGQLGWWQVVSVPLQTSLVQGFKSSAHGVPFALIISMGHAPDVPEQVSATSHGPAEGRHVVVLYASTHVLPLPEQWSPASLSHAPPCELPVQLVDGEAKPSAGHAPEVPVQLSATSHGPAEGRHVVVLYASTHVLPLPEQ